MKPTYLTVLFAWVLFSCASLKQRQFKETNLPSIGAIGKEDSSLLTTTFKQVGQPLIEDCVALSVAQVPFTKSKYKAYLNLKTQKENKMAIIYADSLPKKSKYLHFEIKDKIGLMSLLNAPENKEVQSYLAKDKHCKIISSISVYVDDMYAAQMINAEGVFLKTDANGLLRIEIRNGKEKQLISIPKGEIFAYEQMGFCWGEDLYGKPKIVTLNARGKCPEGTEKNAQEISDIKSHLKF